jgi:hypothetical protein
MDFARRWFHAPLAVLIALLSFALVACGGGDDKKAKPTVIPEGSTLKLTAGDVQVAAAGPPGTLADADKTAIIEALKKYIVAATIDPLHGKKVGDLSGVFTAEAAASVAGAGPDRAAAIDEGMPKATAVVKATTPPVPMVALSDATGAINLVGTTLFLDVTTKASGGAVHLLRSGELVLKRDAGAWKISSYRLTVNRTGAGLSAPTTSSTEKTAP